MEQPPEAVAAVESADEQLPQHTNSPSRDSSSLPHGVVVYAFSGRVPPPLLWRTDRWRSHRPNRGLGRDRWHPAPAVGTDSPVPPWLQTQRFAGHGDPAGLRTRYVHHSTAAVRCRISSTERSVMERRRSTDGRSEDTPPTELSSYLLVISVVPEFEGYTYSTYSRSPRL